MDGYIAYTIHTEQGPAQKFTNGVFFFFNNEDLIGDSLTLTAGSDRLVISLLMSTEEGAVLLSAAIACEGVRV